MEKKPEIITHKVSVKEIIVLVLIVTLIDLFIVYFFTPSTSLAEIEEHWEGQTEQMGLDTTTGLPWWDAFSVDLPAGDTQEDWDAFYAQPVCNWMFWHPNSPWYGAGDDPMWPDPMIPDLFYRFRK